MWKRDEASIPASTERNQPVRTEPVRTEPVKMEPFKVEPVKVEPPHVNAPEKVVMDLGKSVIIKGELSGSEDFVLYGQMEGSIRLPDHTLTIGPHAGIKAEICAKVVVIMGAVTGNVTAKEKVEIQATGSVVGDIAAPRLAIADGGSLRGKVEMPPPSGAGGAAERRR
jgi:cytoskeletal protein CcmA (bactofilin family)